MHKNNAPSTQQHVSKNTQQFLYTEETCNTELSKFRMFQK
jgi:hypothetical protein